MSSFPARPRRGHSQPSAPAGRACSTAAQQGGPGPLRRCAFGLGLSLGLAGLFAAPALRAAPSAREPEQAIRARYLCTGRFDAVELTALFFNEDPSEVILLVGETATRLPRQLAASGSRYAGGDQEFWIKGERARWRLGPHPAAKMECTTQAAQSQR